MTRFTIKEKADYVGTLRTVNVTLMETLARWVPTSPEMEVKVLMGRHLWDFAQHADLLGKRVFELRAPLHFSPPAAEPYAAWLEGVKGLSATADRLAAFYDGVMPAIVDRHKHYLERTDALQDEPTVRILDRILQDQARMQQEYRALLASQPELAKGTSQLPGETVKAERALPFVRPAVERVTA